MINNGVRYYVTADKGDNIFDFTNEVVEFRKQLNRDIIMNFNDHYIHVNENTTVEDILRKYNEETSFI